MSKPLERVKREDCECLICGDQFGTGRALAAHIQNKHKMKTRDYTILTKYDGVTPICADEECEVEPRYVSYTFKKYCKEHSTRAMSKGGVVGGKKSKKGTIICYEDCVAICLGVPYEPGEMDQIGKWLHGRPACVSFYNGIANLDAVWVETEDDINDLTILQ